MRVVRDTGRQRTVFQTKSAHKCSRRRGIPVPVHDGDLEHVPLDIRHEVTALNGGLHRCFARHQLVVDGLDDADRRRLPSGI